MRNSEPAHRGDKSGTEDNRRAVRLGDHFDSIGQYDLADLSDRYLGWRLAEAPPAEVPAEDEVPQKSQIELDFMRSQTPNELFSVGDGLDVHNAYRNYARRYHPDTNQDPDAAEAFKLGQEAMERIQAGKGHLPLGNTESTAKFGPGQNPDAQSNLQTHANMARSIALRIVGEAVNRLFRGDDSAISLLERMPYEATQALSRERLPGVKALFQQASEARDRLSGMPPGERGHAVDLERSRLYYRVVALFAPEHRIPERTVMPTPAGEDVVSLFGRTRKQTP